jgi:hypothetical protein
MAGRDGVSAEVRGAIEEGASLYNSGLFWECHEILERVWLREFPPRKEFLQGIIKVAAGYHHFQRGNWPGMSHLLEAGRGLLEPFRPSFLGVELEGFVSGVAADARLAEGLMERRGREEQVVVPPLRLSRLRGRADLPPRAIAPGDENESIR